MLMVLNQLRNHLIQGRSVVLVADGMALPDIYAYGYKQAHVNKRQLLNHQFVGPQKSEEQEYILLN